VLKPLAMIVAAVIAAGFAGSGVAGVRSSASVDWTRFGYDASRSSDDPNATGITAGACLGTSTITCYIESAAGVAAGGRTGLTAVVTGLLFLLALLFGPLVKMMAGYPPLTAPALVIVGAMMMQSARRVAWDDPSEAVPVFLTMAGIPLSSSIADGLALGFIAYPVVKFLSGRRRDVHVVAYIMAALLVAYFLVVRYRLG
jgi:AGZA family xanthine/uracil permease-like MFS transporter